MTTFNRRYMRNIHLDAMSTSKKTAILRELCACESDYLKKLHVHGVAESLLTQKTKKVEYLLDNLRRAILGGGDLGIRHGKTKVAVATLKRKGA